MKDLFRDLQRILATSEAAGQLSESLVKSAWRKAAGENLDGRTKALSLNGSRLTVAVNDENWRKHLEGIADQMIFRINNVLGGPLVTFIELVCEPSLFAEPTGRDETPNVRNLVDDEIVESANAIEDLAVREDFLKMAARLKEREMRMTGRSES